MYSKEHGFIKYRAGLICILFLARSILSVGQAVDDTLGPKSTLSQCITFALAYQSLIKQSLIDESITERDIRIALSGWYPQMEINANLQHYLKVPIGYTAGTYGSTAIFTANQTLYDSKLFFAARTSRELRNQASENTENSKIDTYVNVTKAFFDVLLTEDQLVVLNEDILRLQQNYKDAYNLYKNGLTDNIDYQRTEISLSNAQAQRKSAEETIKAKYAVLKQYMGVAPEKPLTISYDSSKYEKEILFDTTKNLDYTNRIEYKILQSSLTLQGSAISYYKWSALPAVSAFYDFNLSYGNEQFLNLYKNGNQNSIFGLTLSLPLFQGMSRLQNLSKAKLQYQRLQHGLDYLKSEINSEYTLAFSTYISNLNEMKIAKKNISVAKHIFNTVKLQYEKGIKAYLEVIVSETDLRTTELNYLNTLFRVLSSKMDLEKALGVIKIN